VRVLIGSISARIFMRFVGESDNSRVAFIGDLFGASSASIVENREEYISSVNSHHNNSAKYAPLDLSDWKVS